MTGLKTIWVPIRYPLLCLFSIAGVVDTLLLVIMKEKGSVGEYCSTENCSDVLYSTYSTIANIPLSVLGLAYYVSVLWVSVWLWRTQERLPGMLHFAMTTAGFLMSSYFVYLQGVVLDAWCTYCLFSAGTSTLLFVTSLINIRSESSSQDDNASQNPEEVTVKKCPAMFAGLIALCAFLSAALAISLISRPAVVEHVSVVNVADPETGDTVTKVVSVPSVGSSVLESMIKYVPRRKTPPGGNLIGDTEAPVTVQVYLDYTCGHCRSFENLIFPKIKKEFIDTKRIKWIIKSFARSSTGPPLIFGMAGVCGREEADPLAIDHALFNYVPASKSEQPVFDHVRDALKKEGLNPDNIMKCLETRAAEVNKIVVDEVTHGRGYGLRGPPGIVIDGIAFQGGMDFNTFAKLIDIFESHHHTHK